MITKQGKKWKLDFRPNGASGKRVIRLFDTKGMALQYHNTVISQRDSEQTDIDNRTLNDLINIWYDLHGVGLKSSADRKNRLLKFSERLHNPIASNLDAESFGQYRLDRLSQGIKPATLNHELSYIKALYSELKRLSVIDYDCPIVMVKKLKSSRSELAYLTSEQIKTLLKIADSSQNESLPYIVNICLATGARWSEAQQLTASNCINQGFQFIDTKNGKNRFIPVEKNLFHSVKSRLLKSPFKSAYWSFRVAFARSGIILPNGQLSHVLRHTFASHFIINGGNVIALQRLLGHSSLNVTMRYAHLAPNYLHEAVKFNPLNNLQNGKIVESI